MSNKKLFPCANLMFALMLGFSAVTVNAQTADSRPRLASASTNFDPTGISRLENDVFIVSLAEAKPPAITAPTTTDIKSLTSLVAPRAARFNQLLLTAIDARLGAPYVYGSSGPNVFDCSGFVWSAFQSAGIQFGRTSARSLWSEFAPVNKSEEHKFGTLVFFNNQTHIGIVAEDGEGFYHASCSHGVTYSPFKGYWENRIDGFRRAPLSEQNLAE
jgi:peptidoglycan endopeptidase LytE